jgi:nitrogen fixation NifU-like protein
MIKKNDPMFGKMKRASSWAHIQGPCGDTMEFFLKISGSVIRKVCCYTSGCGASKSCALETARMAQGKSLAGALLISPGKVIQKLRHIPDNHLHCAILSVSTLHRAIAHYLMSGKRKIGILAKGLPRER